MADRIHGKLGPHPGEATGNTERPRHVVLGQSPAIRPRKDGSRADAASVPSTRFEREAPAVAALSHPNILAIHDFGTHEGTAYAVMELLEGETLRGKLDSGPISQKQAADYALQVVKGLSAAHEKGIVHRDLKALPGMHPPTVRKVGGRRS